MNIYQSGCQANYPAQTDQEKISGFDALMIEVPAIASAEYSCQRAQKADLVSRCASAANTIDLSDPEKRILKIAVMVLNDPEHYHSMSKQMAAVRSELSRPAAYFVDNTLAEVSKGDLRNLPGPIAEIIGREAMKTCYAQPSCSIPGYPEYIM